MKGVGNAISGKSLLLWLDEMENRCQLHMQQTFVKEIDLLERQIGILSSYVNAIGNLKRGSRPCPAPIKDTTSYVRVKDSLASGAGGR